MLLLLISHSFSAIAAKQSAPAIQLANIYHQGIDLQKYLVSEKLDGVRAYWDGKHLLSKGGNVFNAPDWFVANFPAEHLEGELWIGRGKFAEVSGIVRRKAASEGWRKVHWMLFDMPQHSGSFAQRLAAMQKIAKEVNSPYLLVIEQKTVASHKILMKDLNDIVKKGGEGLMLHRKDSLYQAVRNDDILKLKTYDDAEARVLAYVAGKGKYQGMMGSLMVENEEGINFKIGGGFTVEQRQKPPKIGSIISYKHYGKTKNNKPRFASFLKVRENYDFQIHRK